MSFAVVGPRDQRRCAPSASARAGGASRCWSSSASGSSRACGWRTASCCAIMPPIEAPQTCALGHAQRVEQAGGVVGHVGDACRGRRPSGRRRSLIAVDGEVRHAEVVEVLDQADVAVVEADHAETACHQAARRSPSCQATSCMPRPMISTSGSPLTGPWSSTSSWMPLALKLASGQGLVVDASGWPVRKNQRRAPCGSNGCHWPGACASRSAIA